MTSTHNKAERDLKPGEVWVGNHDVTQGVKLPDHLASLKTARLAEQAYDMYGAEIEPDYMRPLIIHATEADAYDKIMMGRLKAIGR